MEVLKQFSVIILFLFGFQSDILNRKVTNPYNDTFPCLTKTKLYPVCYA